jgi:hypothetical protein
MASLQKKLFWLCSKSLPRIRTFDRLLLLAQFIKDHKRLPRMNGGSILDAYYHLKTTSKIMDPVRVFASDKALVKIYVAAIAGEKYNVPTLAILNSYEEAASYAFPPDCVIKPTHMSGKVIFRKSGSPVDPNELASWFKSDFYLMTREANYRNLKPRVIVEPYIFGKDSVDDYKIFCVDGRPLIIQVDNDRFGHHTQCLYTADWLPVPYTITCNPGIVSGRPGNLDELLATAAKLSSEFSIVRIDLYTDGKAILLGEITNIHQGGQGQFRPPSGEAAMTELFFGKTRFDPSKV